MSVDGSPVNCPSSDRALSMVAIYLRFLCLPDRGIDFWQLLERQTCEKKHTFSTP